MTIKTQDLVVGVGLWLLTVPLMFQLSPVGIIPTIPIQLMSLSVFLKMAREEREALNKND